MIYCYPLGTTNRLINSGEDPHVLEYESVKALEHSKKIKYASPPTKLRRLGGEHALVYIFLIEDMHPVMYAKYAVKFNTANKDVLWLGWHASSNSGDRNFHPLNY